MIALTFIAVVIAVLTVILALQNLTPVALTFLMWQTDHVSLALVVLVAVAAGVLIGLLAAAPALMRGAWSRIAHNRQVTALEARGQAYLRQIALIEHELQAQVRRAEAAEKKLRQVAGPQPAALR
jgi:uncharacterized integral membrane protein